MSKWDASKKEVIASSTMVSSFLESFSLSIKLLMKLLSFSGPAPLRISDFKSRVSSLEKVLLRAASSILMGSFSGLTIFPSPKLGRSSSELGRAITDVSNDPSLEELH